MAALLVLGLVQKPEFPQTAGAKHVRAALEAVVRTVHRLQYHSRAPAQIAFPMVRVGKGQVRW